MDEEETVTLVVTPPEEPILKKFSDLTDNDIKVMTEEDATNYAVRQGWKSPDKFSGDKSKLKSAKEYLTDTFNEAPVLKSNLKKQTDKVESLMETMSKNTKLWEDKLAKQEARYKKDLEMKLKEAESKLTKSETEFDVAGVKKATEEVVEFKNELSNIEEEKKQAELQEKSTAQQKVQEWQQWSAGSEADELRMKDPVKYRGFEMIVGEVYTNNKHLSTKDIIAIAKERAYPKAKAPTVQGASPANKTTPATNRISAEDRELIMMNVDNECNLKTRQGLSGDALKTFRKSRIKHYEEKLGE